MPTLLFGQLFTELFIKKKAASRIVQQPFIELVNILFFDIFNKLIK